MEINNFEVTIENKEWVGEDVAVNPQKAEKFFKTLDKVKKQLILVPNSQYDNNKKQRG